MLGTSSYKDREIEAARVVAGDGYENLRRDLDLVFTRHSGFLAWLQGSRLSDDELLPAMASDLRDLGWFIDDFDLDRNCFCVRTEGTEQQRQIILFGGRRIAIRCIGVTKCRH